MTDNILSKALQLLKMTDVLQISEIHPTTNGHIVIISVDNKPYKLSVDNIDSVVVVSDHSYNSVFVPRFAGINLN